MTVGIPTEVLHRDTQYVWPGTNGLNVDKEVLTEYENVTKLAHEANHEFGAHRLTFGQALDVAAQGGFLTIARKGNGWDVDLTPNGQHHLKERS